MYERGLDKLDQALDLPFELPGSSSEDLERVRKNRTKMLRTRQEIVFRIRELSASNNGHISDDTNCRADKEPDPGPSLIASSGQEVAAVAASGAMSHEPPPSYEHATSVGGETELLPSDALILFQIPDRCDHLKPVCYFFGVLSVFFRKVRRVTRQNYFIGSDVGPKFY